MRTDRITSAIARANLEMNKPPKIRNFQRQYKLIYGPKIHKYAK